MDNFNQLLNQHIQRAGISDAELARAIGVSRQTIFRWREGSTARPRQRDDVLAIARKLRLSPEEQDHLLLAAGFRPNRVEYVDSAETTEPEATPPKDDEPVEIPLPLADAQLETPAVHQPQRKSTLKWWGLTIAGLLLLGIIGIWGLNNQPLPDNLPTSQTPIAPAKTDETLVVVTHFANYASSQVGYNVAGRLADTLEQEIEDTELQNIRIAIWPEEVADRQVALQTGQQTKATLVVYGEYDVGRVVVNMAYPNDQTIFTDPALQRYVVDLQDLSTTINSDLPQQVRSLALVALGQIYLGEKDFNLARLLLLQAKNHLANDPAVEEKTWGLVNFYLGIAHHKNNPPHLDEAITAYTEAIEAWPGMISSLLNRGAAYEVRNKLGDLEKALKDAEAVVDIAPEWASGYNNRASIRLNLGGPENLALAMADVEKTLTLNPDLPEAYINQAYINLQQTLPMTEVAPVLEKALALRPNYGTAFNVLCWGYALEEQSETALPYCQQAIEADATKATYKDSRGIVYAQLGDYQAAITDFTTYVTWLADNQPGPEWEQDLALRQSWIEALQQNNNPITNTVLDQLRQKAQ